MMAVRMLAVSYGSEKAISKKAILAATRSGFDCHPSLVVFF